MQKLQRVAPQMKAIQAKYNDDKRRQQGASIDRRDVPSRTGRGCLVWRSPLSFDRGRAVDLECRVAIA
jgi:hypothetical protein